MLRRTLPVAAIGSLACSPEPPTTGPGGPVPGVPVNLSARAGGVDRIDLSWSSPENGEFSVVRYRLYRDGVHVADPEETSHSDVGLEPFTAYEYRVSSLDRGGGESASTDAVAARTLDASPPGSPGDLTARAVSSTQIDLAWAAAEDPESGVGSYVVYRNGAPATEIPAAARSFSDTGLNPSTSYSYRVAARNADGLEGATTASAEARTAEPADPSPPSAPTGLRATAAGPSQIDLRWSAASDPQSGVARYRVRREGSAVVPEVTGTAFSDTGLEPEETYTYRVSAVNGEGVEGPTGPSVRATTPRSDDPTPPTSPRNLEVRSTGPSTASLTWTAAEDPESGVSFHRIYRDGVARGQTPGTAFADGGLASSTTYRYEVAAVNGDGLEGERSGQAIVRTDPDDTPPTSPATLTATAAGPAAVSLTWTAAADPQSGVASYRVYRDGAPLPAQVAGTSFTDAGLQSSTAYAYRVTAVNGDDLEGDPSPEATARTDPDDTPPTVPGSLTAEGTAPSRAELSWTGSSDPESGVRFYRVYRDGVRLPAEVTGTTHTDTGLRSSTTYGYRVSAVNWEGLESGRSAQAAAQTLPDATPPSRPATLSAEGTGPTAVELTWTAASDPQSGVAFYRVYRDGVQLPAQVTGTSYADRGLRSSTDHAYRVSAVNGEGMEGDRSPQATARTHPDATPPSRPTGLTANATGPSSVRLAWAAASDPQSGVAFHRVYRNGVQLPAQVTGTTFVDTGLAPSSQHTYRVSAVNGDGLEGNRSTGATVQTDPPDIPLPGPDLTP